MAALAMGPKVRIGGTPMPALGTSALPGGKRLRSYSIPARFFADLSKTAGHGFAAKLFAHPLHSALSHFCELRGLAGHPKVAAIGETGLDYHHPPSEQLASSPAISALQAEMTEDTEAMIIDGAYKAAQSEAFAAQLDLAAELGLNVVIHQRDAWDDTLEVLAPYNGKLRAVFHCFGNLPEQAREIIGLVHLVSFTGIVTFKNAQIVRDVVAGIPADAFMVETDCPYLAPIPFRGKRCEPAYSRLVAEKIAEVRGVPLNEIAAATEATAAKFFRFQ